MFFLTVAWRYLTSNTWQSALLIAGVALGVMAYVFITALVQGLAIRLTDDVTANSAHISLEPPTRFARILTTPGMKTEAVSLVSTLQRKQIRNWRSTLELIRQQRQVTAISPQIGGNAFLVRGEAVAPVAVTSLEPENLDAITPISEKIVAGTPNLVGGDILIGIRLAETLGLSSGQPVLFRTDRGVERLLIVRGIYRTGIRDLDERVAILSIQVARPLFLLPDGVTNIEIKLHDPADARLLATFLEDSTGLKATPWQERNEQLDEALVAQARTGQMIQAFSLISILVGIASALMLSANRRRSEIGIMRAFGISKQFVAIVFLAQGLLIGLVGALLGCLTGFGLCVWLAGLTRPDGTMVLPIAPSEGGYLMVLLLTTLGAALASLLPARGAAGIDPLEAIQQ
jgi:lipoprotein-releasing system permease protein